MKIVIASDSFKGCCSTLDAAEYFKKGILRVFPDATIYSVPVADGGEGTLDSVISGYGGQIHSALVKGATGRPVNARFGIIGKGVALIEAAEACGLTKLREDEKNPLITTTYGVGELIGHALDLGCKRIYIGLGGSSTNDGGSGMLEALGARYFNEEGGIIHGCGGTLGDIARIEHDTIDSRVINTEFIVMSDVSNPLCGPYGASNVFGRQKGADDDMVAILDKNLEHFAKKSAEVLYADHSNTPGAGSAGGLGFAFLSYLNAKLQSGIESLLDLIGFTQLIMDCDLVITGEGNIDAQSLYGKVPIGIARRVKSKGIPLIVIAGGISKDTRDVYSQGISSMISGICRVMDIEYALENPDELLSDAAERAMRLIQIGMKLPKNG